MYPLVGFYTYSYDLTNNPPRNLIRYFNYIGTVLTYRDVVRLTNKGRFHELVNSLGLMRLHTLSVSHNASVQSIATYKDIWCIIQ